MESLLIFVNIALAIILIIVILLQRSQKVLEDIFKPKLMEVQTVTRGILTK